VNTIFEPSNTKFAGVVIFTNAAAFARYLITTMPDPPEPPPKEVPEGPPLLLPPLPPDPVLVVPLRGSDAGLNQGPGPTAPPLA
jgi:hypothetical protein